MRHLSINLSLRMVNLISVCSVMRIKVDLSLSMRVEGQGGIRALRVRLIDLRIRSIGWINATIDYLFTLYLLTNSNINLFILSLVLILNN